MNKKATSKNGRVGRPALSGDIQQIILRLERSVYDKIKARAVISGRSANREMAYILERAVK